MSKKSHDDRAYQQEIVDAVLDYLRTKSGNPVVASPGGTGKSHCMNRIIKYMVTGWAGTRVMLLAQDAKLLDQNCNSMLSFWPNAPVGIYSSQLRSRDTLQPIIYAGIQSVAKRPHEFGFIDAVFVDECDQVSHKDETLYQKFITALKEINPGLRVIGFTATPYRLGMGCLTNIDLWDEICIDLTKTERFNWFIDHGFLSPLVTKKTCKEIDVSLIGMKGGEFNDHEMQEVADTDELNRAVVEECIRYGHDRNHWLVFATGVKHGHHLAKLFNSKGVRAVMLSGEDSVQHREEMEAAFRAGEYRCLVHVGLYGRGWDFPALDLLAWARATQSTSLWVQGCVRLTRVAPGKVNGLVLDFAGNTRRLGPVNDPIVPSARRKGDDGTGEAPVKECPECHSYIHTRIMVCPDCGYEFPPPSTVKKTASEDEILRSNKTREERIVEHACSGVRYKPILNKKGTYYLRCSYFVGTGMFHESLFFESPNAWARRKLEKWWKYRGGKDPFPEGTDEAAKRTEELRVPTKILVDLNSEYKDVVGVNFDGDVEDVEEDDVDEAPF